MKLFANFVLNIFSICMNKTQDDENSYKALRRRIDVACEFCDRIFNNR